MFKIDEGKRVKKISTNYKLPAAATDLDISIQTNEVRMNLKYILKTFFFLDFYYFLLINFQIIN